MWHHNVILNIITAVGTYHNELIKYDQWTTIDTRTKKKYIYIFVLLLFIGQGTNELITVYLIIVKDDKIILSRLGLWIQCTIYSNNEHAYKISKKYSLYTHCKWRKSI